MTLLPALQERYIIFEGAGVSDIFYPEVSANGYLAKKSSKVQSTFKTLHNEVYRCLYHADKKVIMPGS